MTSDGKRESAGWVKHAPKRFYTRVIVAPLAEAGRFTVTLDDRPLRCPGGAPFSAPRPVAEAAAEEWEAVAERIDPSAMPVTKAVNSAVEQVAPQREAVIEEIAGYGGSDLLCYRAEAPQALAAREAAVWDPVLDWAGDRFGARLKTGAGITPIAQPPQALDALRAAVSRRCDLGLTALSDLVGLSGSLLLGLAVAEDRLSPSEGWSASRIDEDWQIEQWGRDAEAEAMTAERRKAFEAAGRLAALLRG